MENDRLRSVMYKMTRAREHFDALLPIVDGYYEALKNSSGERPKLPGRLGLICGDCLQNLRSTLDYLVTELVGANGSKPNRKHMFPIALTRDQFEREAPQKLAGIDPIAFTYIESFQPFLRSDPQSSVLYAIDELTNLNKHRRPIFTSMMATESELPILMPHAEALIKRPIIGTDEVKEVPIKTFIAFDEEPVKGMEIVSTLHILAMYIGDEVLPLFVKFLK